MKVRELIEELQKHDPEAMVIVADRECEWTPSAVEKLDEPTTVNVASDQYEQVANAVQIR